MDEICSRLFWFFSLSVDHFILRDSLVQSICGMGISHHEHCSFKYFLILVFLTDYFNHLFVCWRSRFLPFFFFHFLSSFLLFFFFLSFFLHLFRFSFYDFFFFFFTGESVFRKGLPEESWTIHSSRQLTTQIWGTGH